MVKSDIISAFEADVLGSSPSGSSCCRFLSSSGQCSSMTENQHDLEQVLRKFRERLDQKIETMVNLVHTGNSFCLSFHLDTIDGELFELRKQIVIINGCKPFTDH